MVYRWGKVLVSLKGLETELGWRWNTGLWFPVSSDSSLALHHSGTGDPGWTISTTSEEFVYSVICGNRCKDTYPLCQNSYWLRFLVAMKQVPVLVLHFSLNYPKDFHIEHIFPNRINFSRSNKPRHFFSSLSAIVVVCIKCDVTDKRYGPVIQLGGG